MSKQLRKFLAVHLVLLIILQPGIVLSTDITVDTGAPLQFQPDLVTAPSGTPVVNITRPTAGGVSRNIFSDYSVGESGLILNNSTGLTKTELAGYILANPKLQCAPARLILNEVTGINPTRLNGYTEIAGSAADLIVANPNGISINGGGFINTPRVTLTTGVTEWENDNFTGLHVAQGQINIDGQGFNAANVDRLDIYARAISINAELWARQLNMVTGQNRIAADGSTIEKVPTGNTPVPQFALDSTALGGMYADQISLLGTEKGVGVHLAGDMAASGADIRLTVDGRLELLARMTGQNGVSLNAGEITVATTGEVLSGKDLQLSATSLLNEGNVIAADDATFSITENLTNRDGLLFAFNNMAIYGADSGRSVASILNDSGRIETWQGDLLIRAEQLDNISKTPVVDREDYSQADPWQLLTATLKTQEVVAGYHETLAYSDPSPALISSGHNLHIQAKTLTNLFSTISATNDLLLEGDDLENSGRELIHEWTTTTNQLIWKKKHTKYHTQCKYVWMANPPVIDGPNAEIVGSVPAIIEAGGSLMAIFDTSIGNGEQREAILTDTSLLPDGLGSPATDNSSVATLSDELSSLFQAATTDSPYLIETRPLFADKATFVNSDYLLGQLDYQLNETLKRLGDGFYETVLIRDSILQQTGQRFLDVTVTSDSDQYTRLMDAALIAAEELELSVGVALNREQVASLTHDIVWFVAQDVDGQKVLVPQLYLGQLQPNNLTSGSRIVATGNVSLLTGGSIANAGEIFAGNNLNLVADADFQSVDGELASGNMTLLVTGGNIAIAGGRISGGSVALQAEENIEIESRHQVHQNATGYNTVVGQTAGIVAEDVVTLSGNNITLAGAEIEGDVVDLSAEQNLSLTTIENSSFSKIGNTDNYSSINETRQVGSSVKGKTVSLSAGEDLILHGSQVAAQQDGQLVAGGDLTITSAEERSSAQSRSTTSGLFISRSSEQSLETVSQRESVVAAGGRLDLYAGVAEIDEHLGDLTLAGSQLNSGSDLSLYSGRNIFIAATDESSASMAASRKSNLISNQQDRTVTTEMTLKKSELNAGGDLLLRADNDISMIASNAYANGDAIIAAGNEKEGNINLLAGDELKSTTVYHRKGEAHLSYSKGFVSFARIKQDGQEITTGRSVATVIKTGGDTILLADNDVNLIGAEIASGANLYVDAQQDVNILAAAEVSTDRAMVSEQRFGVAANSGKDSVDVFFGVETTRNVVSGQKQLTAGSNLTAAGTVSINAKRNVNQIGSSIAAGHDLQLRAGDSINSLAGEESATVSEYNHLVRLGITSSLQHNIGSAIDSVQAVGKSSNFVTGVSRTLQAVDAVDSATQPGSELHFGPKGSWTETDQSDSYVAPSSLYAGRDLLLEADKDITLSGTVAIAERDMQLIAENVRLLAARDSHSTDFDNSSFKAGLTTRGSKSTANVTVGGHGAIATADAHSRQVTPVQLVVGENLTIKAASDIEMEGSQISVENDVYLDAGNELNIHAAMNDSDSYSNSYYFGAEGGYGVTVQDGQASVGYMLTLNAGQDRIKRRNAGYLNTHIDAVNLIDLSVGGDAKIEGARLTAEDIHADIDGDLLVSSVRDTGKANGLRWNASITLSTTGVSGISAGFGQTKGKKDWISEQTALIARNSADLYVGGHTQLNAAVIASETGNLKLDTETFAFSDHAGVDEETSFDISLGFSSGESGEGNKASGAGVDNRDNNISIGGGYSSFERRQIVRATIGEGNIIVRSDRDKGINSIAGLNRDLDLAYEGTRDRSSDYEFYVSTNALKRVSNPGNTFLDWKYAAQNYGHILVDATKGVDLITRESPVAKFVVEKLDPFFLGIAPTRRHHGGIVAQLPNFFWGGDKQKIAFQMRHPDDPYVEEHPELFMKTEDIPFFDAMATEDKEQLKGLVITKHSVEINKDNAMYQNYINGMLNTLADAAANAKQQTQSGKVTIGYNPTHGFVGDLLESGIDKLFGDESIHSGQAAQTSYFMADVIAANGEDGSNFVMHSQGNLLVNAGLSLFSDNVFSSFDSVEKNRITFFANGSPVANETLLNSVQGYGLKFAGSNVNDGDVVGETLGGNKGLVLYSEQTKNVEVLDTVQRLESVILNGSSLLGDKYPAFDRAGNQINSVSPHSGYSCVVNCGEKSPWEKAE